MTASRFPSSDHEPVSVRWRPQAAFVLAAGLGTRMQPLTRSIPKPLVKLGGRPLVDHVLDRIVAAGIERCVVNVHYKADKLEVHLRKRLHPRIVFSDERARLLDTGGGLKKALPLLGEGPVLVHNSDSVWIEGVGHALPRLFEAWDETRMDCLMLLALGATALGYEGRGDFLLSPEGQLSRVPEAIVSPFVFTGVSIAHPRLLEGMPDGPFSLNLAWNQAIERGRLYGVRLDGRWMHVGTPQALIEAEQALSHDSAL